MNIYLDIDGVLLVDVGKPAHFANEFLQAVLKKYPDSTYWLTTHVWNGEHVVSESLAPYLQADTQSLLGKIKPTSWGKSKTDGIDFTQPFLWFDDDLFEDERTALNEHGVLQSHIFINLFDNPDQLEDAILKYFS